jgi:hypothetical protein
MDRLERSPNHGRSEWLRERDRKVKNGKFSLRLQMLLIITVYVITMYSAELQKALNNNSITIGRDRTPDTHGHK